MSSVFLHEPTLAIHNNVGIWGFDAKKVNSHDDYLSFLDTLRLDRTWGTKIDGLRRFQPKKFRQLMDEKMKPRGLTDLMTAHNKAPDNGLEQFNKLLRGASVATIGWIQMGKGTNAPASGDTDLQTPVSDARHAINDLYAEGKTINHYDTFYLSSEGNDGGSSVNWTESGVYTAVSGPVMVFRLTFGAVTKTITKSYNIAWSNTLASLT